MAVTYTATLLARAEAWLTLSTNAKRQPAGLQELADLWAGFQGRPAGTCRQCQFSDYQRDVVAYVREFSRSQTSNTVASSYQIAPAFANETFVHEDLATPMTAANITDEAVELLISKGYDTQFVKVGKPADAEEAEKPVLKLKADFQGRYAELFGAEPDDKVTVDDLKKHIAAKEADETYEVPAA